MNERGHVVNAVLLSVGVGIILEPSFSVATAATVATVAPPIVLGALFPDIDTSFGTHRKTFHNVWVLAIAVAFPVLVDNLHYVWIGIATHYVLDLCGNVKGMAMFYPISGYYDVPVGVTVGSKWADAATLAVTGFELAALGAFAYYGHGAQIAGPDLPTVLQDLAMAVGLF